MGTSQTKSMRSAAELALEGLEARQLMSVTLEGGVLEVSGSGRRDAITIRSQANRYVLTENGQRTIYERDRVRSIQVHGNKGHDNITVLSKLWSATEIRVNGGLGRDQVTRAVDDGFPAPPLLTNAIYASAFGAVGDGVSDDAPAIQAAIDSAAPGSTIVLDGDKTYLLTRGLVIQKSVSLEGRGATLLLRPNSTPENSHVRVLSKLGAESYEWMGSISEGQTEFMVAAPGLKAGDTVYVELGHDPYDVNEQHFAGLATVVSSDGFMVKLDTPALRDINQGAMVHRITRVASVAENVTVRNLRFDWVGGTVIESAVWVHSARGVTAEYLRGRFSTVMGATDSTGVVLRDVKGELLLTHGTAARVLVAWQSDVEVHNVQVNTSTDSSVIFTESWNRRLRVDGLEVHWGLRTTPQAGIVHLTGGSTDAFLDNVVVHNAAPVRLVTSGDQVSEHRFGRVEIDGTVIGLPLALIDSLKLNGTDYGHAQTLVRQVPLTANLKDWSFPLLSGIVKKISAALSNQQGVQAVFIINGQHQGPELVSLMTDGRVDLPNLMLGEGQVFNVPDGNTKSVHLYTGANLLPGTMLTLTVEYYPQ